MIGLTDPGTLAEFVAKIFVLIGYRFEHDRLRLKLTADIVASELNC